MGIINVEGLGEVEIEGTEPTPEEQQAIFATLNQLSQPPSATDQLIEQSFAQVKPGDEKEASFLREAIPQMIGGIGDATQNLLNLATRAAGAKWRVPLEEINLPSVSEPETTGGGVVRGISQFMVPYLGAMKVAGLGQVGLKTLAKAEGLAAIVEQGVFDPFDQRLSDLMQQFPSLQNPVTEYLQSDPDDSEVEARFKMALEGIGAGVVANSLIGVFRGLRRLKKGEAETSLDDVRQAEKDNPRVDEAQTPDEVLAESGAPPPDQPVPRQVDDAAEEVVPYAGPNRGAQWAGNINLKNIDTIDDIKEIFRNTEADFATRMDEARRGVIGDEQLKQLANEMNLTVDQLTARHKGEAWPAEKILAARQIMVASAAQLHQASVRAAKTGLDTDVMAAKDALNLHVAIQEQVAGLASEAGRALRQFRNVVGVDIGQLIDSAGGKTNIQEIAKRISVLSPNDLRNFNRVSKVLNDPKLSDKWLEVWINGLLSGPQTHAVNITSNALTSLWSIPERYLAAAIGAARKTPNRVTLGEANSSAYGWLQGAREGFSLAKKTFITEEPSDLFSKLELPRAQAVSGVKGQIVRIPGRALMSADEFFKSIGYRMELNAQAYRSALNEGLLPRSREFAEHMQEVISNPPRKIHLQAIDNARYLTFTKPLEGVSKQIVAAQNMPYAGPLLRVVMPFVRTPVNIVRFASERTPLGLRMRETMRATGVAKDKQVAKMILGTMAGGAITSMAMEGKVTGSGPRDPAARKAWRDTGWQPYSFVFENKGEIAESGMGEVSTDGTKRYLAYNRIEPLGIIFGLAADFADIAGSLEESDADELAAMIAASISQNLTNKTFFKGLSDIIEAVNSPERRIKAYVNNLAGTAVPSVLAQTARAVDPVLRDTRTSMQRVMSRIPGFSEDIPANRNLWGQPIVLTGGWGVGMLGAISPIYSSFHKNDPVADELIRLKYYPSMPPRTIDGEDIPQEMYWQFVEEAGKPAHALLTQLVTSPEWKRMDGFPSEQKERVREILTGFRTDPRRALKMKMGLFLPRKDKALLDDLVNQAREGLIEISNEDLLSFEKLGIDVQSLIKADRGAPALDKR